MSKRRTILVTSIAGFALLFACGGLITTTAKKHAESFNCASSVTSICLAARLWADDHGGFMPTNFTCMSNEVATPKVLSCIASRRAGSWAAFTAANCTYEIMAPGMRLDETNRVYLRCSVHGHLGYSDATVFDGVRRRTKFGSTANQTVERIAAGGRHSQWCCKYADKHEDFGAPSLGTPLDVPEVVSSRSRSTPSRLLTSCSRLFSATVAQFCTQS